MLISAGSKYVGLRIEVYGVFVAWTVVVMNVYARFIILLLLFYYKTHFYGFIFPQRFLHVFKQRSTDSQCENGNLKYLYTEIALVRSLVI